MNFSEDGDYKRILRFSHLNTHKANRQLDVRFTGTEILGVTLDRTLTYNAHLTKTSKKVNARINIVRKLAGTVWGAGTETLRTAALAIVYWLCQIHPTTMASNIGSYRST
jgi:hypothetical protein